MSFITPLPRRMLYCMAVALSLLSQMVYAGDTTRTRFLSLDSAITLGIQHSHQVELSGAQVTQAQAAQNEVKDLIMPNLEASVGYTRLSNIPVQYFNFPGFGEIPSTTMFPIILNNYSAVASLQESVFNGFQWKYGVMGLGYTEKASEYALESRKKDVALNVITAYLNLFKLQKAHYLIEQSLTQIRAHVKEVSDFVAHGLATQNDLLRTKLQESNTELSEIDVNNQVQTVNYNLCIMLGLSDSTIIKIDTTAILDNKTIQPLPYYLQKFSGTRADLQAAAMQQKAQEANIKETQSGIYPKLLVSADYDYLRPNPRIVPPLDQFQATWDLGFRLSYNFTALYDNKNKMDENHAKLAEAQATYNQLSDAAKMEINQDYLDYKQSLEKIDVAQKSLDQATENYRIVKSKYDNHVALLTDLLDANNFLLNAEINLISAKADAQLAYYSLLKATGELASK